MFLLLPTSCQTNETINETFQENASINQTTNQPSIFEEFSTQDLINVFNFLKSSGNKIEKGLKELASFKQVFQDLGFTNNQSLAIMLVALLGLFYILFKFLKILAKWSAMILIVWIILHILGFA